MTNEIDDFEMEELDVEAHAGTGAAERSPRAKRYVIRIDKTKYTVPVDHMTGAEILTLAGKVPPSGYKLTQKHRGGAATTIALDQEVDFRAPGVERLMTLKRDQTEGYDSRREVALPSHDVAHLQSTGLPWETIGMPGAAWILIHDWPVTAGYTSRTVTLALQIPPGYPEAQIDMAYFAPELARQDGQPIASLSAQQIDGQTFQRWSRHRTAEAPWRPGEDDIANHLVLVDDWLERELMKAAA